MSTIKQIQANRRNSKLSTGPTSQAGKAVTRMNALKSGIDAQSQIVTGEDPAALELLTNHYYDRFQPQGPEEVALIDCAISADWLLRRLRKAEAEMWNRSIAEHEANLFKWGQKPEKFPVAAAFLDEQKAFDRLQRRISAAERSLRASLETLARLRKLPLVAPAVSAAGADPAKVGPVILSPANAPDPPSLLPPTAPTPPITPSKNDSLSEIGSVPQIPTVGQAPGPAPLPLDPPSPQPTPDGPEDGGAGD
jgi:hypothetical protein